MGQQAKEAGLTNEQREKMRHALGLNRKARFYRNHYHAAVNSPDADLWAELVGLGYAALVNVENNLILFTVTDAGRAALSKVSP